jgi:hypothetical protein
VNIPDTADALKNLRDDLMKKKAAAAKKKQAAGKSTGGAAQPPEHVMNHLLNHLLKRRGQGRSTGRQGEEGRVECKEASGCLTARFVDSTLLSDLSSFDEPTSFLDKSFDYILPADEKHLQKKKIEEVFDTTFLSAFHVSCLYLFFL